MCIKGYSKEEGKTSYKGFTAIEVFANLLVVKGYSGRVMCGGQKDAS